VLCDYLNKDGQWRRARIEKMLRLAAGDECAMLLDFGIASIKKWQPSTR
jgi:hypothetical protein